MAATNDRTASLSRDRSTENGEGDRDLQSPSPEVSAVLILTRNILDD